jgi:hypothetical protein
MGAAWAFGSGSRGKYLGLLNVEFTAGATGFAPSGVADSERERLERIETRVESLALRVSQETDPARRTRWENQVKAYEKQAREAQARVDAAESGENVVAHRLENTEIALSRDVDDNAEVEALVEAALDGIVKMEGGNSRFALEPHLGPQDSPYIGSDACVACHKEEHLQWSSTSHAHAWQSLVNEKRHLDRDCFSCHATGVGKPGGPKEPTQVRGLRDVQCEACHGPGARHVSRPDIHRPLRDPGIEVCRDCHDGKQDGGRFDYSTYRPKVVHGTSDGPSGQR